MLSATINLTVMVSDMCYGKCNVNVPAVCLHKANRSNMSNRRGNYVFVFGAHQILVLYRSQRTAESREMVSRGFLFICQMVNK